MTKGKLLLPLVAALVLALAGCGKKSTPTSTSADATPPATNHVVVAVYGGDWEKQIRAAGIDQFEKQTGIHVDVVAGADAQWFAQLRASNGKNPPYDLLILQPDTIGRAVSAGLLQPLDTQHVPHLADLYPSLQQRFTFNGKTYGAAFSVGQLGIAYRSDLVPTPPKKWLDLWNPEYKGHVAISSPSYAAGLQFFVGLIHALGGQEKNPADVDRAFAKLAQLKGSAVGFPDNPGAIQTLLQRGDAWVVPFWDGRVFALQKSGLKIGFAYPEDGPVAAIATWAIPKNAPDMANAYKLLDYLSTSGVQKSFAEASLYGMANRNVQYSPELSSKIRTGAAAYDKLTWIDYSVVTPLIPAWTERWAQVLGGNK